MHQTVPCPYRRINLAFQFKQKFPIIADTTVPKNLRSAVIQDL